MAASVWPCLKVGYSESPHKTNTHVWTICAQVRVAICYARDGEGSKIHDFRAIFVLHTWWMPPNAHRPAIFSQTQKTLICSEFITFQNFEFQEFTNFRFSQQSADYSFFLSEFNRQIHYYSLRPRPPDTLYTRTWKVIIAIPQTKSTTKVWHPSFPKQVSPQRTLWHRKPFVLPGLYRIKPGADVLGNRTPFWTQRARMTGFCGFRVSESCHACSMSPQKITFGFPIGPRHFVFEIDIFWEPHLKLSFLLFVRVSCTLYLLLDIICWHVNVV